MMRIESACLQQTLMFETQEELDTWLSRMKRRRVPFKVLLQEQQENGSVKLQVARQYTHYPTGEYLK